MNYNSRQAISEQELVHIHKSNLHFIAYDRLNLVFFATLLAYLVNFFSNGFLILLSDELFNFPQSVFDFLLTCGAFVKNDV